MAAGSSLSTFESLSLTTCCYPALLDGDLDFDPSPDDSSFATDRRSFGIKARIQVAKMFTQAVKPEIYFEEAMVLSSRRE
eukprot:753826-Hanusia_phi.AAC.2